MSVASEDRTVALRGYGDVSPAVRRDSSENPRRLLPHTWVLTTRILRRWSRDPATVVESLIMPVALLVTQNIVLGDGISQVTGHSALYGSVPLVAMVAAMSGATVGGIGLMRERTDGLLSRLWVLPVHRASGLLSRLAADAVRIVVTTAVIMCAGLVLGFRFRQGILESVAWLFIPTAFGVAFSVAVITLALYSANTIVVEATADHLRTADVLQHRLRATRPVSALDSAGRRTSAGELCHRGDARIVARWPGVGTDGGDAAVVGGHRRRVRDTDGDRVSKGQHAWMISSFVFVNCQGV